MSLLAAALLASAGASAYEAGDWIVRGGAVMVARKHPELAEQEGITGQTAQMLLASGKYSASAVKANIMHNMKSIYGANNRMNLLIYPLSVIETLDRNARILVIGPRNENDLLSLVGLGFKRENVIGLDLISYSSQNC
jgi:hypothetical protein